MNLTFGIFDFKVRQLFPVVTIGRLYPSHEIKHVLLWDGVGTQQNALYIGFSSSSSSPHNMPSNIHWLTIVEAEDSFIPENDGYYVLCPKGLTYSALNKILQIMPDFYHWQNQLQQCAKDDLQQMVCLAAAYLQVDLSLIDYNFNKLAVSYTEETQTWPELFLTNDIIEPDVMQMHLDYPELNDQLSNISLTPHPRNHKSDHDILYFYNIHFQNKLHVRLMVGMKQSDNCSALRLLLEYVGNHIKDCYVSLCYAHSEQPSAFSVFLKSLFENESYDKNELLTIMQTNSWYSFHKFEFLRLVPRGNIDRTFTLNYYRIRLEQTCPECVAFVQNTDIFCLHNCSLTKDPIDFQNRLSCFLRDNLFHAGISNTFTDIFSIKKHRLQADDALLYGAIHAPNLWKHSFSSYSLHVMLEHCKKDYDANDLCHPAIYQLASYDAEHPDSELLYTLKQYIIHHFNATQTAESLGVHRTTFLYRLGRIQELTSIKLEDFDTLLHLLLSFKLREE